MSLSRRARVGGGASLLVVVLAGCDLDASSRMGAHAEVAGAAIFDESGTVMEPAVALPSGGSREVTVKFLDARGHAIPAVEGEHFTSLSVLPAGRAMIGTVEEKVLSRTIGVVDPCRPPTYLMVGYGHDLRADERVFGPFPVSVPRPVAALRILAVDSSELTPHVRLPSRELTRVVLEFLDCDGHPVSEWLPEDEIVFFWSGLAFAEVQRADPAQLAWDVFMLRPSGTDGYLTIGLSQAGAAGHQLFGPYALTIE